MKLSLHITAQAFEALPESIRELYVQYEDGSYTLPVDGAISKTVAEAVIRQRDREVFDLTIQRELSRELDEAGCGPHSYVAERTAAGLVASRAEDGTVRLRSAEDPSLDTKGYVAKLATSDQWKDFFRDSETTALLAKHLPSSRPSPTPGAQGAPMPAIPKPRAMTASERIDAQYARTTRPRSDSEPRKPGEGYSSARLEWNHVLPPTKEQVERAARHEKMDAHYRATTKRDDPAKDWERRVPIENLPARAQANEKIVRRYEETARKRQGKS